MIGSAIGPVLPAHLQALRGVKIRWPGNTALCVLLHREDLAALEVNISGRPNYGAASETARQWKRQ